MPDDRIMFRCYRCGKLLGAPARRSGAVVACPQCRAEIQVPEPVAEEASPAAVAVQEPPADVLFPSLTIEAPGDPVLPPIRYETPPIRPAASDAPRAADVVLPPAVVLAWSLLVLMAVPAAFVAGLLIGHFIWK